MKRALFCATSLLVLFAWEPSSMADDFLDKLKSATEKLQQIQRPQPNPQPKPHTGPTTPGPQVAPASDPRDTSAGSPDMGSAMEVSANAASPSENAGTPEATAVIAKTAGKYDVLGIKLGMPAKEATAILQSRGLQFKPETVKYDMLPNPLTYGLYALNPLLVRNNGMQPGAEKLYLMLTMPPNEQLVSKVNRFLMFTKDTAPTQQVLAADLIKKYGPVSFDSAPGDLYRAGVRDMFWADDAQGNRLKDPTKRSGQCQWGHQ